MTHAYNCTVSPVTGFSPYFLMFGRNPELPLDIDLGIPTMEQEINISTKLCTEATFQVTMGIPKKAQENNKKESECHKKYYDQKMRCMKLEPDDLVMVRVKALTGNHKIADRWEDIPHRVIDQLGDQPVFKVQVITAISDNDIRVLHRNMLFPLKTSEKSNLKEPENQSPKA